MVDLADVIVGGFRHIGRVCQSPGYARNRRPGGVHDLDDRGAVFALEPVDLRPVHQRDRDQLAQRHDSAGALGAPGVLWSMTACTASVVDAPLACCTICTPLSSTGTSACNSGSMTRSSGMNCSSESSTGNPTLSAVLSATETS